MIAGVELAEIVGNGATALVYRGHQPALGRDVAVKIINGTFDDAARQRFEREQVAMGRLSVHPGIVPIYQSGLTITGQPYLVMPFFGDSLADELLKVGRFDPPVACAVMAKVCDAVQFAHDQGIVHRDIKPGKILCSPMGDPMIADFGIAQLGADDTFARQDTSLTPLPKPSIWLAAPPRRACTRCARSSTRWCRAAPRSPTASGQWRGSIDESALKNCGVRRSTWRTRFGTPSRHLWLKTPGCVPPMRGCSVNIFAKRQRRLPPKPPLLRAATCRANPPQRLAATYLLMLPDHSDGRRATCGRARGPGEVLIVVGGGGAVVEGPRPALAGPGALRVAS